MFPVSTLKFAIWSGPEAYAELPDQLFTVLQVPAAFVAQVSLCAHSGEAARLAIAIAITDT